jgi:hypothetical protein
MFLSDSQPDDVWVNFPQFTIIRRPGVVGIGVGDLKNA